MIAHKPFLGVLQSYPIPYTWKATEGRTEANRGLVEGVTIHHVGIHVTFLPKP